MDQVPYTVAIAFNRYEYTIDVITLLGADGVPSAGVIKSGKTGAPSVNVRPSLGSLVLPEGHNFDQAKYPVPLTGQRLRSANADTQIGDTFWAQVLSVPTNSIPNQAVKIGDSAPSKGRWSLAAVSFGP